MMNYCSALETLAKMLMMRFSLCGMLYLTPTLLQPSKTFACISPRWGSLYLGVYDASMKRIQTRPVVPVPSSGCVLLPILCLPNEPRSGPACPAYP